MKSQFEPCLGFYSQAKSIFCQNDLLNCK